VVARATSLDANADESRWLLDKTNRAIYESEFFKKAAAIAQPPSGQTYDALAASVVSGALPDGFQGALSKELHNITFTGEKERRTSATTFATFMDIDAHIRSLENAGNHDAAVAVCIGKQPNQSDWAFLALRRRHRRDTEDQSDRV